jgi:hypothetical protein
MHWILALILVSAHADSKKLLSECYDGNSGKACLQLAKNLAASSDHERAKLARRRACSLGETSACAAAPSPAETNETMVIQRAEVEGQLSNLPELLEGARLEARSKGFEFVQIESQSAYAKLGFRLGDILLEINGHQLESAAQAMELFVLLRSETDFKVKLKRKTQLIERRYTIKE